MTWRRRDDMFRLSAKAASVAALSPRLESVGDVVAVFVPHHRGAGFRRLGDIGDGGQRIVVDHDQFGGVLGLGQRVRDDHDDRIADVTDPIADQRRPLRGEHRGAVAFLARHVGFRHGDAVGDVIGRGVNGDHAGRRFGRVRVDTGNVRVRVWGADEDAPGLARQDVVILIMAAAGQQPHVFITADRLADAELCRCIEMISHGVVLQDGYARIRNVSTARSHPRSSACIRG